MSIIPSVDDPDVVHVVSLVVVQSGNPGLALLGVRNPTITSGRHPDVLSSPTMRVPSEVMWPALSDSGIATSTIEHGEIRPLAGTPVYGVGVGYSMESVISYLAEHLMARKLGMADALVTGRISGVASAAGIAFDTVHDSESEPQDEHTLMLTIEVSLDQGVALVPTRTESYSRLDWVPASEIRRAVEEHDPIRLVPDADPLSVCLHGLCVRSAAVVVEASSASGSRSGIE